MSLAMERKEKKDRVIGAIEAYKLVGLSDEDIVAKVMKIFSVTKEYVTALLEAQAS